MNVYAVALFLAVLFSIGGQLFLKKGALQIDNAELIRTTLFNISLLMGLTLYVMSTFLYIFSLRKLELSVAYPTSSLSFVVLVVLSFFLFNESITVYKIIGITMILGGIFFLWR